MDLSVLNKVKGDYVISVFGDYIVFYGQDIRIFHISGAFVARRKDLRNVCKVAALSENRLIIDCASQGAYIILSLLDGSEICRIKFPEMHYAKDHFTVSPDGTAVYDIICLMETFYLLKIDLESKKSTTIKLHKELRGIDDVICDKDGVPCLLASHYETVAGKYISINGVRCVYLDSPNPADTCDWKAKWHHDLAQGTVLCVK